MTRDDDRLLERLAAALGSPVPADLTADARAVYTWRDVDAELLALGFDSAVDELVGVRSVGTEGRVLRFQAGEVDLEIDVVDGGLEGVIVGIAGATVALERPDGAAAVLELDTHGRFRAEGIGTGPLRLVVTDAAGRHVTEWFLV